MKYNLIEISLLRVAGPFFFILMQLSALLTTYKIFKAKSVGEYSSIPFLSLMTNCAVWTLYGTLTKDETVLFPNITGLIVGDLCSLTFYVNSIHGIPLLYITISIILLIIAIALGIFHQHEILGELGVVLAVLLMGSPLSTVQTVISTKSTKSMPFNLSLMTWFNSLSWSLYGIIVPHDPLLYTPNLVGFMLTSIQLSLFVIYGFENDLLTPQSPISNK